MLTLAESPLATLMREAATRWATQSPGIFFPIGYNARCNRPHIGAPVIFSGAFSGNLGRTQVITSRTKHSGQLVPHEHFYPHRVELDEDKMLITSESSWDNTMYVADGNHCCSRGHHHPCIGCCDYLQVVDGLVGEDAILVQDFNRSRDRVVAGIELLRELMGKGELNFSPITHRTREFHLVSSLTD